MEGFYRFMFLNSEGRVFHREEFTLADDGTAVEKATALASKHPIEIWDGARRVALVQTGDAQLNACQAVLSK
jgi:hypothetical protein